MCELRDLGPGFGLVPLSETNVTHKMHPRVQMHPERIRARLPTRYRNWALRQCDDIMAMQAKMILRGVLHDILSSTYDDDFSPVV